MFSENYRKVKAASMAEEERRGIEDEAKGIWDVDKRSKNFRFHSERGRCSVEDYRNRNKILPFNNY